MKRTQIYLDERQAADLARRSDAQGVTSSHLIREAIERYLAGPEDEATELQRQRASLREAFGSLPRLSVGSAFVEEIRGGERIHDEGLERRWRSR